MPRKTFRIYERCLETMTEEAERYAAGPVYLRLGQCFLRGAGTEADDEKALVCFQKAEFPERMPKDTANYDVFRRVLTGSTE